MPERRDIQTTLSIALQTKGFDRGLRDMMGVSQKVLDGLKKQSMEYGKVQDKIKGMQAKIQGLAKDQMDAGQALEKITDKTGAAYRYQTERMEKAREATTKLKREIDLLQRAHRSDAEAQEKLARSTRDLINLQKQAQQQSRWAMTQGIFQGMGMGGMAGMFMQRGPGFWRQFAGQRIGGMARRVGAFGAGVMQAPFQGIQGLQQALSAIPGGGVLAGQLGAVAAHSQQALQWQRERVQLSPFLETAMPAAARKQLGGIGRELQGLRGERGQLGALRGTIATIGGRTGPPAAQGMFPSPYQRWIRTRNVSTFQTPEEQAADPVRRQLETINQREAAIGQREATLQKRKQEVLGTTPMGMVAGAGRRLLGMGRREAAQQAAQLFQVAGGRYTGTARQGVGMEAAFAAQTMFGVGPEAAGGFLMGGRRGGLVGGRGRGPEALTEALQDALELGLEGSEITKYMQQVAQGIQEFQQTGIPMNKDSIKSMTLEFGRAGIGGVRGTAMAQSVQRYVQGIGQRGITGGMDLLLMQKFGGFQGGGPQAYEQAILQMEAMQGKGAGAIEAGTPMGQMVQQLVEMGGGAKGGGVTFMRRAMGRMGMQMSMGEAMAMTERITGEKLLTPEQREAFGIDVRGEAGKRDRGKTEANKIQTVDQLVAAAAKRVHDLGPNLEKQATIMDKQLEVGSKALKAVQNLEDSSLNLNDTFMQLANPLLTDFSTTLQEVTAELNKLVKEEGGLLPALRKMIVGI